MYIRFILLLFVLTACSGTLSDEQRKKLKERMAADEIKHVSEAELMEASFDYGRTIVDILTRRDKTLVNRVLIDSLEKAFQVNIVSIIPGDSMMLEVESKIIEAYTAGASQVQLSDDIQKLGTDSMLYTKPVVRDLPDGSVEFTRAIGIHMPVRSIILSIKD